MYFNIHTHNNNYLDDDVYEIINLFPNEHENLRPNLKYSIGIHPAFISEKTLESELEIVKKYAAKSNVIAIGEIGLDKNSKVHLYIQRKVFIQQLEMAERLNKPVIIHCVKCFSEILALKKHSSIPWIIHGFRGKSEFAAQLLKKNISLSFGDAVLNPSPTLLTTLTETPIDKIFLETDNSSANIKQIYQKVAEIKKISIERLIEKININVNQYL